MDTAQIHFGFHISIGTFRTSRTAEYPASLCLKFAEHMVEALAASSSGQVAAARLSVGGSACVPLLFSIDLLQAEIDTVKAAFDVLLPNGQGSLSLGFQCKKLPGDISWDLKRETMRSSVGSTRRSSS